MILLAWYATATESSNLLDDDILKAMGVAAVTFIIGPMVLFILTWLRDSVGNADKKADRFKVLIVDEIDKKITPLRAEIHEDFVEIRDDIRRIEDILLRKDNRGNSTRR